MADNKRKKVLFKVDQFVTDRHQFKPYMATLSSKDVFVEVMVPESQVISTGSDGIVLTPEGLATAMDVVANALDEMHEKYLLKFK